MIYLPLHCFHKEEVDFRMSDRIMFLNWLKLLRNNLSGYIDGLGDAVEQGLVKAVGVSNYSGKVLTL